MNNVIKKNVLVVVRARGSGQFPTSRTSRVNPPNVRSKNQGRFLGQGFGTAPEAIRKPIGTPSGHFGDRDLGLRNP
jgi:hypothetical protein